MCDIVQHFNISMRKFNRVLHDLDGKITYIFSNYSDGLYSTIITLSNGHEFKIVFNDKEESSLEESYKIYINGDLHNRSLVASTVVEDLGETGNDFLNQFVSPPLSGRSSPEQLKSAADKTYKDLNRIGKTDPVTTSNMNLAGYAAQWLGTQENKSKYDNTLAMSNLKDLDKAIEIIGRNKFLGATAIKTLTDKAAKLKVSREIALEYIEQYAHKRKWGPGGGGRGAHQ